MGWKSSAWAKNTDDNQAEMVAALRKAGRSVWVINGTLDLGVGYGRQTYLLECKRYGQPIELTESQKRLISGWKGGPIYTVRSIDEALDLTSGVLLK